MARALFIVSRGHHDLYTYLRERFAGDEAVEVVLDRRIRNRRQHDTVWPVERRRADRRSHPEIDAELRIRSHAVLTLPGPPGEP